MVRQSLIAAAVAVCRHYLGGHRGLGTDRDRRPSAHDRASGVAADPRLRPAQRALLCDALRSCGAGRRGRRCCGCDGGLSVVAGRSLLTLASST
jgi:hypothetical protein